MPTANQLPLINESFNSTATILTIPVSRPQATDENNVLLAKIANNTAGFSTIGSGGVPSAASGNYTAVAPYYAVNSGAGTTPASLTSFSVYNSGPGTGLFNGAALPPGVTFSFNSAPGSKFSPVSFNGSGNSIYIAGAQLS